MNVVEQRLPSAQSRSCCRSRGNAPSSRILLRATAFRLPRFTVRSIGLSRPSERASGDIHHMSQNYPVLLHFSPIASSEDLAQVGIELPRVGLP